MCNDPNYVDIQCRCYTVVYMSTIASYSRPSQHVFCSVNVQATNCVYQAIDPRRLQCHDSGRWQVKKKTSKEDMAQNIPGRPDESQHLMGRGWTHCDGSSSLTSSCCPMYLLAPEELRLRMYGCNYCLTKKQTHRHIRWPQLQDFLFCCD